MIKSKDNKTLWGLNNNKTVWTTLWNYTVHWVRTRDIAMLRSFYFQCFVNVKNLMECFSIPWQCCLRLQVNCHPIKACNLLKTYFFPMNSLRKSFRCRRNFRKRLILQSHISAMLYFTLAILWSQLLQCQMIYSILTAIVPKKAFTNLIFQTQDADVGTAILLRGPFVF